MLNIAVAILIIWLTAWYFGRNKKMRDCDCTSRDPWRCMQEQCFDLGEPDHDPDDCEVCAHECACYCHWRDSRATNSRGGRTRL